MENLTTISHDIKTRKTTPVKVVENCLRIINELQPETNAFITILADQALADAKKARDRIEAGEWLGMLDGIPIAVKDFYDTAGIKTTAAFKHFKNRIPKKDAVSVTKLKDAGAILIGKTNMHELGMGTTSLVSHYGPVRNPINPDFIAGGSSGGSAAAVASGMCFATLDTDAIGSCRLPASSCGIVGFKGTYGLISPEGILEGEKADETILWLAHPGISARSVSDVAAILDVLALKNQKPDEFQNSLLEKRAFKIGAANNYLGDEEIRKSFEGALVTLRGQGYSFESAAAPFKDPSAGIKNIESDRKNVSSLAFSKIDLLVLPVTASVLPTVKEAKKNPLALSPANTAFANYYGLPAISIPCGLDSRGMPIGFQIVGRPWEDAAVLNLASRFEKAFAENNSI